MTRLGWLYAWDTEGPTWGRIEWQTYGHDLHNTNNYEEPIAAYNEYPEKPDATDATDATDSTDTTDAADASDATDGGSEGIDRVMLRPAIHRRLQQMIAAVALVQARQIHR